MATKEKFVIIRFPKNVNQNWQAWARCTKPMAEEEAMQIVEEEQNTCDVVIAMTEQEANDWFDKV